MATNTNQKLAVLIDADNAQASVIQELLAEVSRYGTATIKRAYGDWTTQNLRSWKDVLHTMAKLGELIRQQAAYLEVKEVKTGEGDAVQTHLHVRRKAAGGAKT
jgi:hypothetical protein